MAKRQLTPEEKYNKMVYTPVPKLIIQLGLPTIASMLITSIYNMADTYFVGTLGKSASGAVGVVFSLMAIIQAFGFLYGHGSGSILARKLGQHDTTSASRFGSTGFFMALTTGGIIGILGLTFLTPFMYLLGSTDTILPHARQYAFFILLGAPFFAGSCVLNNILRYEGMSLFAMIGLVSGGLLNMALDPLFILVFDMGTAGAGLATALSQCVSFSILLFMFLSGKTSCKLHIRNITHNLREIIEIITVGLPSLIRQGLGSLSAMILNHQAGVYGDAAVAAMSIVTRITQFIFSVNLGIGQGFQPVSSFNFGAKKYSRVKQGFWCATAFSEALLFTTATFCFVFAEPLVQTFQRDPSVVVIGIPALRFQSVACLFLPFFSIGNMMFQSTGQSKQASVLATLRSGLCFIPLLIILPAILGLHGIMLSQPIADVLSFSISLPLVFKFLRRLPKDDTDL